MQTNNVEKILNEKFSNKSDSKKFLREYFQENGRASFIKLLEQIQKSLSGFTRPRFNTRVQKLKENIEWTNNKKQQDGIFFNIGISIVNMVEAANKKKTLPPKEKNNNNRLEEELEEERISLLYVPMPTMIKFDSKELKQIVDEMSRGTIKHPPEDIFNVLDLGSNNSI